METSHHYRRCRRYPSRETPTPSTAPASTTLSQSSLLSPEIHLLIASYLGFYDMHALRLTSQYFACLLPPIACKRPNYEDDEELLAHNADWANNFKISSENFLEAEQSYLARSYGLASCTDCGYLRLSWESHYWWFGPRDQRYGYGGERRCRGCEPQVTCACWWGHDKHEMREVGDAVVVLAEPEWMGEEGLEESEEEREDGLEVVDVDRI